MDSRLTGRSTLGARRLWTLSPMLRSANAAATPHGSQRRRLESDATAACTADVDAPDRFSNAKATSLALWNRSAGFFSRQWSITRTTPGGTAADVDDDSSGGSSRRIAVSVSAAVSR